VIPHEWAAPALIVANSMGLAKALTITSAVPLSPPEVAVIVVDPFAIGVTRPKNPTLATSKLDDDHAKSCPATVSPLASCALAVNCTVSMRVVIVVVSGTTTTEVTVEAPSFGPVPSEPQPVSMTNQTSTGTALR
jgi:hypothetical protein